VTSDERWLAANWPFVRGSLPAAPARVVEVGCGPLGGFVPMMEAAGYQAIGVDPEAPPGPSYRQVEFERYRTAGQLDAIVACTSLHHVADLAGVLDLVAGVLVPGGRAVIVEWARERFDEATARWCFARLPGPDDDLGWLHQRQAEWHESGQPWEACLRSWVHAEGLHAGQDILQELDARFDCRAVAYGPYFFADLAGTSDADEQAAIDSGLIQANRIQYVGRRKKPAASALSVNRRALSPPSDRSPRTGRGRSRRAGGLARGPGRPRPRRWPRCPRHARRQAAAPARHLRARDRLGPPVCRR
jgi:SAM-dependent methyltransferase